THLQLARIRLAKNGRAPMHEDKRGRSVAPARILKEVPHLAAEPFTVEHIDEMKPDRERPACADRAPVFGGMLSGKDAAPVEVTSPDRLLGRAKRHREGRRRDDPGMPRTTRDRLVAEQRIVVADRLGEAPDRPLFDFDKE